MTREIRNESVYTLKEFIKAHNLVDSFKKYFDMTTTEVLEEMSGAEAIEELADAYLDGEFVVIEAQDDKAIIIELCSDGCSDDCNCFEI